MPTIAPQNAWALGNLAKSFYHLDDNRAAHAAGWWRAGNCPLTHHKPSVNSPSIKIKATWQLLLDRLDRRVLSLAE